METLPEWFKDDDESRTRFWKECCQKYLPQEPFNPVMLSGKEIIRVRDIEACIAAGKPYEDTYQYDGRNISERCLTGGLGERSFEIYMGWEKGKVLDPRVGSNRDFHHADIGDLGVGVKAARIGLCPMVPISPKDGERSTSQVICIVGKHSYRMKFPEYERVWILGLATPEVLQRYSDVRLIENSEGRRGTKHGFWGFEHLRKPSRDSLDWLKPT